MSVRADDGVKFALSSFAEICGTRGGRIAAKVIFSTWRRVGGKSIIEVNLVGGASPRRFSLFYISIRNATRRRSTISAFDFTVGNDCCASERVEMSRFAINCQMEEDSFVNSPIFNTNATL